MNSTDEAKEFLKKEGYEIFVNTENRLSNSLIVVSGGSVRAVALDIDTSFKTVDTFGIENDNIEILKGKVSSSQIPQFLVEVVKHYLPAPNASLEKTKPSFGIIDFLNDYSTHVPKLAELSRWEQDYLAIELLTYIKKNDKEDEPIIRFAKSIETFLTTINIITANSFYQVLFDNINSWGNHFHSKLHSTLELRDKTWRKLDLINGSKQAKNVFKAYIRNVVNVKFNELLNSANAN